jgi:hypothetical protein
MTIRSDTVSDLIADRRPQTRIVGYFGGPPWRDRYETSLGWWHGEQSGEHG